MQTSTKPAPELLRELNAWHAVAIVAGTIIGSGIFRVPGEMMKDVGSAGLVYLVWIVGGMLSFAGALTYAELGAIKPWAGGEYVYIRDAYGPLPGFLYAWTWFLIAKPASIASVTTGIVDVLSTFPRLSFLAGHIFSIHLGTKIFEVTNGTLVAIVATILISALNYVGVRKAGGFQLVFTALKVGMIVAIIFIGFTAATGSWGNFHTTFLGAKGGFAGFMAALVAALWAYDGWNDLNMVSGEISNPGRNIPLALIAGVALVAALYMGINAAVQYVMPAAMVAGRKSSGVVGDTDCHWIAGRRAGLRGHGFFYVCDAQRDHHERRTRTLCRGARWIFLQETWRCPSPLSYSGAGDCGAGRDGHFAAAGGRSVQRPVFAGDLCRMALLYDRGQYHLCLSQD